ncbi:MAG: NPXTG-anchored protein [Clostridia bacterium]|nr:NPXTG-anchored protein [Clostridia bacterium]
MKLAKKVLATVMAVAMIFALSALAFAAGTPTVALETKVEDEQVIVSVYFKDSIGLKSWDLNLTYDASVLEFSYNDPGADAAQVGLTKSNSYTDEVNPTSGLIKWSGYFKTELTDAKTFADDVKKKTDTVDINSDYFEAVILVFDIINADATSTDLQVEVTNCGGVELTAGEKTTVALKEEQEEPSSAEQEEPSSSEEASSAEEEGSKPIVPDTGDDDKNTDAQTWAIAAAAGVAALAGAAFIVSKKRK